MVYGIITLLNFAHGDIIMIGAYIAWVSMAKFAVHPVFAIIAAILGCVLLGVSIEKAAYKPLRGSPRISICSLRQSAFPFYSKTSAQMVFGANAQVIPPFLQYADADAGFHRNFRQRDPHRGRRRRFHDSA